MSTTTTTMTNMTQTNESRAAEFAADIPLELALAAHAGSSFVPEQRAAQVRAEYGRTLAADLAELEEHADTDAKRAQLELEFARYREAYRRRCHAYLASRSRVVSPMIAGPANFPGNRMRKRNDIVQRRLDDLVEFRARTLAAIRLALHPELQPIMSSDSDAVERLEQKIADAERIQDKMKAANAAIRQHAKEGPEAQLAALLALGLRQSIARNALKPDILGQIGFPDYAIRNNGANIRRMKQRIGEIRVAQSTPAAEIEGNSARIEDVPADNRVRLFFLGKPDVAIRSRLKSAGFRWAPTLGAWQAYRSSGTLATAREIAGVANALHPRATPATFAV